MSNQFVDFKHIVHISTNITTSCEHCSTPIASENLADNVNHYMDKHGYKLLHVGGENDQDNEGKSIQHTVAVLGKR
jgi:hypothetical protein